MTFAHILVATDFSEPAEQALQTALALAKQGGARITLLHVCRLPAYSTPELGMYVPAPEETHDLIAAAQRELEELRTRNAESGVAIELRWCVGEPADGIAAFAERDRCDLVVVGAHGRRGWRRFALGSVAAHVVRTVNVPVLTVHAARGALTSVKKILAPTDFSPAAEHAVAEAVELARTFGASVTLLHAFGMPPPPADVGLIYGPDVFRSLQHAAEARLADVRLAPDVTIERKAVLAMPADAIAEEIERGGFDLVVMGTHGRTGFRRLVLGSVAERVVRESPVPVLTMHPAPTRARAAG